jgi:hypothetical protein
MPEKIPVPAVVKEKTYVGNVSFPAQVPERFVDWLQFPEDVFEHAATLGLDDTAVKLLMALLRGKWALSVEVDLQDIAAKTGLAYADMDRIIRGWLDKNYARLNARLDLYRFWIVLLHLKGIRFVQE